LKRASLHIVGWIIVLLVNNSCIDEIGLDLPSGPEKVVVFGWITNEEKPYEIKISVSNNFSDLADYESISGAEVYVMDQLSNRYDFVEISGTGRYISDSLIFRGETENAYQLTIIANGTTYMSDTAALHNLSPIDEAYINFIADPAEFEIEPDDDNFFVSAFVNDDLANEDFYRWKVIVNEELRNRPEELVLFSDKFTNGNRFRFDAGNVLFNSSDQVHFIHMSLSKDAFEYYELLKDQTDNSTLTPKTQPAIIQGNINNIDDPQQLVLGYFGASEVVKVGVSQ